MTIVIQLSLFADLNLQRGKDVDQYPKILLLDLLRLKTFIKLRKTILILALVMLLRPIFPVIDYVVNYDYVATVLCVNKAKPQMHCNGKCHLMKEMAKEAENEKPISTDKKSGVSENEILFFQLIQSFESIQDCYPTTTKINVSYSNLYSYLNSNPMFHPPTFNI